jgi:hypothetical protein
VSHLFPLRPRHHTPTKVGKGENGHDPLPWGKVCALIVLASTAVIAPFFSIGYYPGTDVTFHVGFWFEMVRQWHEGIAYPRWAGQSMYGYGNPTMIFYPPLSRVLGGVLVACLPSRMALGAYAWLGLVLGGFGAFRLCRQVVDDRSSLVGAFAYVVNPYNLAVLYFRGALSEFLAAALFPWFISAVYGLGRKGKRNLVVTAVLIALLWLANVPAAVIANYAAAIFVVALAWVRRSKWLPGLLVLAEILGAGLAVFYLFPAWHQQPLITIGGLRLENSSSDFLFSKLSFRSLGGMLTTGFLWQVGVGGVVWFKARRLLTQRLDIFVALTAVLVVSALMCLPISSVLWRDGPFLSYVQFPWRWLFSLNLAVAFFIAAFLSQSRQHSNSVVAAFAYSILLILCMSAVRKRVVDWNEFTSPFKSGVIYDDAAYTPRAAGPLPEEGPLPAWLPSPRFALIDRKEEIRRYPVLHDLPIESAGLPIVSVQSWQTESRVFTVDSREPVGVRVRLFYYPGWHALVNGTEVEDVERDEHDAVVVRVPSGRSRIQLVFRSTPDEIWGMIVSGLVAILAMILMLPWSVPKRE